ncbi:hypothetical protein F4820DRAFT_259283 [Hypoxylon rubiginosum]|uniref:Uncharacterized protein n=1 Tax=Hypoxylon rubiginosum TaxID=110542 RepID=A0ACB9ZFU9_9PEZI|nr:hypothetical protein F4820DRAFT_259283 [Hypoxylon rubiginosum]
MAPTTCDTASLYKSWGLQQGPDRTDDGCLPSKWVGNGYDSPGVCPSGYTNACSDTQSHIETTICCPTQQAYSCASSMISDRFGCSLYFSSTTTFYNVIDILFTDDIRHSPTYVNQHSSILAYSVQVRKAVQTDLTQKESHAAQYQPRPSVELHSPPPKSTDIGDDYHSRFHSTAFSRYPPAVSSELTTSSSTTLDFSTTNFLSPSSVSTQTKSQSLSSPLSTQSRSVTPSPPAQVNALAGSTIAGIAGGVIGALLLGVVGTFVFMRRSKLRKSSRSSRPAFEKPVPDDQSHIRASMNVQHELDEQRNPSEMPSWDEQNPHGPNKPMAWEMQGSNKFTVWELPA